MLNHEIVKSCLAVIAAIVFICMYRDFRYLLLFGSELKRVLVAGGTYLLFAVVIVKVYSHYFD